MLRIPCFVFWLLRRLTGASWRSAIVAALFALHPLHVESVAWAVERKDNLSTFFGLLSLLAYARYAEAPSWRRYALVGLWLALGLMAKPMLVTWPFVFLLLDYWPLRRLAWQPADGIERFAKALGATDSRKTAAHLPGRGFDGHDLPGAIGWRNRAHC